MLEKIYTEMELSFSAIEYAVKKFENGHALAKAVLQKKHFASCEPVTLLPSNICEDDIADFRYGGMTSRTKSLDWLTLKIQEYLRQDDSRVVVLEDSLAKSKDPCLKKHSFPFFSFHEDVYYLITADLVNDVDLIKQIIKAADNSYLFVGIMTRKFSDHIERSNTLSNETIDYYADQTEKIFVGAFDAEGYIILSDFADIQL